MDNEEGKGLSESPSLGSLGLRLFLLSMYIDALVPKQLDASFDQKTQIISYYIPTKAA